MPTSRQGSEHSEEEDGFDEPLQTQNMKGTMTEDSDIHIEIDKN